AVRVGDPGEAGDPAGGGGDAVQAPDLLQGGLVDAGVLLVVAGVRLHGDGDVVVALGGLVAEGVAEGVGEDQGAGDERYAEHDGEHGNQQPGLVREHIAQGGTEHVCVSCDGFRKGVGDAAGPRV